ncbi:MAG: hypothetical protein AAGH99_03355 [Planctomycetota bacterium]
MGWQRGKQYIAVAGLVSLFVLALHTAPTPLAAEQAPPPEAKSLGVLAPFLLYGPDPDGPWIGETDGNGYRLINPDDPDPITYFYVESPPDELGRRTIEVKTVMLQGDGRAGLLYGLEQNPKEYFLLVVNAAGRVQVLHRTPNDGIVEAMSANLQRDDGQAAGPAVLTLRIVESGDTAEVFVNDTKIGGLQGPAVGRGGVGIGAAGIVDTLFLDFKVKAAGS